MQLMIRRVKGIVDRAQVLPSLCTIHQQTFNPKDVEITHEGLGWWMRRWVCPRRRRPRSQLPGASQYDSGGTMVQGYQSVQKNVRVRVKRRDAETYRKAYGNVVARATCADDIATDRVIVVVSRATRAANDIKDVLGQPTKRQIMNGSIQQDAYTMQMEWVRTAENTSRHTNFNDRVTGNREYTARREEILRS